MIAGAFLLLVFLGSGGPLKVEMGPLPFDTREDCKSAASVAAALGGFPIKTICADANTGEILAIYEKG